MVQPTQKTEFVTLHSFEEPKPLFKDHLQQHLYDINGFIQVQAISQLSC